MGFPSQKMAQHAVSPVAPQTKHSGYKRKVISLAEQATKKNIQQKIHQNISKPTRQNSPTKFPSKLSLSQLFIDIIDAILEFIGFI